MVSEEGGGWDLLADSKKDEYRKLESMFQHPGWAIFIADVEQRAEEMPDDAFRNAKTMDDFAYRKGGYDMLQYVLAFQLFVENNREADIYSAEQEALGRQEASGSRSVSFDPDDSI